MIKSLIFAVAALTVIASGEGRVTSVRERKINTTIWDEAGRLELSVMSQKNIYHRGDEFRLQVMLRNPSEKDVYVAPPVDKSAYVKLRPDHFLGTSYFAPLKVVNLTMPGKYSIFAEYRCPFARADVPVSPFWGHEEGIVKSNVVYVELK